jgi:hypothetical protein
MVAIKTSKGFLALSVERLSGYVSSSNWTIFNARVSSFSALDKALSRRSIGLHSVQGTQEVFALSR